MRSRYQNLLFQSLWVLRMRWMWCPLAEPVVPVIVGAKDDVAFPAADVAFPAADVAFPAADVAFPVDGRICALICETIPEVIAAIRNTAAKAPAKIKLLFM